MKLFKNLLLVLSILLFISCSKDEETIPENKDNILAENAFLIDSTKIISTSDNSFVLENLTTIRKPIIGEIVLSAPSTNCPNGMIRKVIALSETPTSITYQTEQSSLNEAFKQLNIDYTNSQSYSESSTFSKTNGTGTDLTLTFNNKTVGNGVKLNGVIKLKYPTTTFQYEKLPNSYDPKLIILKADLNIVESNLEITNTNSSSSAIIIPKFILATYNLPPFTVNIPITTPIGIFPLPVKFKQKVEFEILPFEINGKFNFKVIPAASATLGAKFTANEGWSNLSAFNFTATTPSTFTYSDLLTNGSVNAQLTIFNPKYSISPLFVDELKATLEFPVKLNFKIQGNQPNYSLKGTVDAKGSVEQKFFRNLQGNYSLTLNIFETTILEGNWDNPVIGTWDFLIVNGSNSWHADVIFKADGTTIYDEPSSPGTFLRYGTWSLNNTTLTYDLDSSSSNPNYIFTGNVQINTMNGTYTFNSGNMPWSATKY